MNHLCSTCETNKATVRDDGGREYCVPCADMQGYLDECEDIEEA